MRRVWPLAQARPALGIGPPGRSSQTSKSWTPQLIAWLNYDTIFVFEKYRTITCVRRMWSPAQDIRTRAGWTSMSAWGHHSGALDLILGDSFPHVKQPTRLDLSTAIHRSPSFARNPLELSFFSYPRVAFPKLENKKIVSHWNIA